MTVNHSNIFGSVDGETVYVDVKNTEKKTKEFARQFFVCSEHYEFDEPTFVELIKKGDQMYLLSTELKFTKLIYIAYSEAFKGHMFRGMPSEVIPKLEKVEFYVRIPTTSSVKLKYVKAQDIGIYKAKPKKEFKYKQKKKKMPQGTEIEFPKE